ncbi:MAG: molybdenum cofactor guanylyltransferase, partial [Candidatus Omnitrophota bacterium]
MNYKQPATDSISCAILAGGKNRRMGKNKAFIEVDGISLLKKNIVLLQQIFTEITIVTNSPKEYISFKNDASIITDKIKDIGPLGGIFSALSTTSKESVFFVACDMPFLHN